MSTTQPRTSVLKLVTFALVAFVIFALAPSGRASTVELAQPLDLDNVVLEWNRIAVEVFHNAPTASTPGAGQPPQVSVLHVAMVQGAIYDAVNTIDGGYQPFSSNLPAADPSASKAAAVATAARNVIRDTSIVPPLSQPILDRVQVAFETTILAAIEAEGPQAVIAGIQVGHAAASAMLAARADDGRYVPYTVEVGTDPGEWRPTPPAYGNDAFAWVGLIEPFVIESADQFRSKGPQSLTSGQYAKEYDEVKRLGSPIGVSERTAEQDATAQFFTANPLELYNRAFRAMAVNEGLTIAEQARLFAMLNMAGADALINCSNDKLHYNFWRPITAIQLGDEDGNQQTIGDPTWTPMLNTPSFSDHPSGYNCMTGAFMEVAAEFFGKGSVEFSLVKLTPGAADITRDYTHFKDVTADTIDARVFQGIHFRTATAQGVEIGEDVARWLTKHAFQPAS